MKMFSWMRRPLLPALLSAGMLLPGCGTGLLPELDQQELPHYELSSAAQAWAAPYQLGEEWRFTDEQGYERRYQVKGLSEQQLPGMAVGTQRVTYYQQALGARLERVDSSYVERTKAGRYLASFSLSAAVPGAPTANVTKAELRWGAATLPLPLAETNQATTPPAGVVLHPAATFGGQTYKNVWEYTALRPQAAWQLKRVYYTKENGVVRFEEAGGSVWTRR